MSTINAQFPFAALEAFQESHPDTNTLEAILAFTEERFIATFQADFNGDTRKARQVYREAQRASEQIVLLWSNLKDTVASPSIAQGLFNNINISESFIRYQRSIPSYNRFFGNLDYREYDACRSIFGPAAYFVDLMRFIETHIPQTETETGPEPPPAEHTLAQRQPGLFTLPLDCDNTYTLIPYIDLINEVLEAVVRNHTTSPEAALAAATFPMTLPVNLPLEAVRLYLDQLKLDLQHIYALFGVVEPAIARELLSLSPQDAHTLASQISLKADRDAFFDIDTGLTGRNSLENVDIFMEKTGLSRSELNTLLFGDLSNDELLAGLSRLFFINNTGDDAGHLDIEADIQVEQFRVAVTDRDRDQLNLREFPASLTTAFATQAAANSVPHLSAPQECYVLVDAPGQTWRLWDAPADITYTLTYEAATGQIAVFDAPYDRLVGLTARKLDRLYRFLKLARQLDWAFVDLDWAIRSFQGTEHAETVLRFDGVNDFVDVPNAADLAATEFTLEAWVLPSRADVHPIAAKGNPDTGKTYFAWWITPAGQLAFFSDSGDAPHDPTAVLATGSYPFRETLVDGHMRVEQVTTAAGFNLVGARSLPQGRFSHVAVTVNRPVTLEGKTYYQLAFYLNGRLDSTWSLDRPLPVATDPSADSNVHLYLGKDFNHSFFTGQISEVRLWHSLRSEFELTNHRFRRCHGREPGLAAYWPLTQSRDLQVHDFAIAHSAPDGDLSDTRDRHPGILGGSSHLSMPVWTGGTLALEPLLRPISADYFYRFNGRDTYVGNQVSHLALSVLTIEAWVALTAVGTHPLLTFGVAPSAPRLRYALWINASNQLVFSSESFTSNLVSRSALTLETLTHVAVTVSATEATLYLNGSAVGSARGAIAPEIWGDRLYLGRDFADRPLDGRDGARRAIDGNVLHGTLQEVRLWNRVKAPDLSRFHQLTGAESGLVGYWRLDEPNPFEAVARDRTLTGNALYPGGILATYQPQLETHNEVILPDPVRSDATVLTFAPDRYPIALENERRRGIGHREQFSLQLWCRPTALSTPAPQVLFAQGESELGLILYLAGGRLHAYAWCADFDGTAATDTLQTVHLSGGDLTDGTWHHVTLTYDETAEDGIELRLYCDGVPVGRSADGFRLDPIGNGCLGGLTGGCVVRIYNETTGTDGGAIATGLGFAGQLADLRLWQIAIAEADIRNPHSRYHQRHIPPHTEVDLICYAPLTEDYGRSVSHHDGPRYVEEGPDGPELPDQSPHRHHGRLYVGPDAVAPKWQDALDLPVFPDRVLQLNGGGLLRLPNASVLGLVNQAFTVELWLRPGPLPTAATPLLSGPGLSLELTATGVSLQVGTAVLPVTVPATTAAAIATWAQTWHHLAWRYEANTHTLFVDGVAIAASLSASGITKEGPLFLGATRTAGDALSAQVSELRIWQTARTDAAIAQHWNQKLATDTPDLAAYWEFSGEPSQGFVDRSDRALRADLLPAPTEAPLSWRESAPVPPPFERQSQRLVLNHPEAPANTTDYPGVTPNFVDLSSFTLGDAGTVELWVQFADDGAGAALAGVLLSAAAAPGAFALTVQSGAIVFTVAATTGPPTSVQLPLGAADDRLRHLAITWQFDRRQHTTRLGLIVDDREVTALSREGGDRPDFTALTLGLNRTDDLAAVQPFRGAIAQFRLWDRVRSFHQIQRLAEADLDGRAAADGLKRCLSVDEATGTALRERVSGDTVRLQALSVQHPEPRWLDVEYALQFDGIDDFVHVEDYVPGSAGTIALWAKFSLGRDGVLFDASTDEYTRAQGRKDTRDKFFILSVVDRQLWLKLEENSDRDTDIQPQIDLQDRNAAEFAAQWHHIVATWTYDTTAGEVVAVLSIDGQQQTARYAVRGQEEERRNDLLPAYQTLYFGHHRGAYHPTDNPISPFQGQIRQIRLWDQTLSAAEIVALGDRPITVDPTGLQSDFPLDEGVGTLLNSAIGDRTATFMAGENDPAQKWIVVERAIAFAGFSQPAFAPETFVTCPNALPATAGTLELWAQFEREGDARVLLDASTPESPFHLTIVDGRLLFQVGASAVAELPLPAPAAALNGGWHHIAAIWQWQRTNTPLLTLQLRLNGHDETTVTVEAAPAIAPQNPYLGIARLESPTLADYRALDGAISQLRIWDQGRSTADLRRWRDAELTGTEQGLQVYLPIQAGSGTRLADRAGNGDATLRLGVFAAGIWTQQPPRLFAFTGDRAAVVGPDLLAAIVAGDATLELWVTLDAIAGTQPLLGTLGLKLDPEAEAFDLRVVEGVLQAHLRGEVLAARDLPLTANTWHHLVCRYDHGLHQLRLAVDGTESREQRAINPAIAPRALHRHVYIGLQRQWDEPSQVWRQQFLSGAIAEIRIWSNLTGSDGLAATDYRLRGDEPDLVANWIFTAASQTTLVGSGLTPQRAYGIAFAAPLTVFVRGRDAQPPLYRPRLAPQLDGYNDYLALGETGLDLNTPHTIEFWRVPPPTATGDTVPWQHLAAVYGNGGALTGLYVNGAAIASTELAQVTDSLAVFLANQPPGQHPDRVSPGQVADFRLWQGQRSIEAIRADQHRRLSGREPNLCGYWPLDEGGGDRLRDAAEYLAPATLITGLENAAEKWQPLPPPLAGSESALFFDGVDDYVILPAVADLGLAGDFTVEAWVRLGHPGASGRQPVLGSAPHSPTDPDLFLGLMDGVPSFQFGDWVDLQASWALDGEWHHLAWQYEATTQTARIFIDGELAALEEPVATAAGEAPPLSLPGAVAIAAHHWTIDHQMRNFYGGIGQVRLWKVARPEAEIRRDRGRPLAGEQSVFATLVADWIFDDRADILLWTRELPTDNRYSLRWQGDMTTDPPLWTDIDDAPILTNPLPQEALTFDGQRQYGAARDVALPTGDWTLEAWVQVASLGARRPLVWWGLVPPTESPTTDLELRVNETGTLELFIGTAIAVASNRAVTANTLTHVAAARQGDSLYLFINGAEVGREFLTVSLPTGDRVLYVGRGEAEQPALFHGRIQELRLWRGAWVAPADPAAEGPRTLQTPRYHPAVPNQPDLVTGWSLATVAPVREILGTTPGDRRYTPNLVTAAADLALGGLLHSRKPTTGAPQAFIDARRPVLTLPLTLETVADLRLPYLAAPRHPHRTRRLIEVWFCCDNPFTTAPQTLYAEGDQVRGLRISVQGGQLLFEGFNRGDGESGWSGSAIATERIQPRHWHHAALVLDGRPEMRDDAFCALLDGRVIGLQPGSQLWGHPTTLSVGGLTFTPTVGDRATAGITIQAIAEALDGQIAAVRIWEADAGGNLPTLSPDADYQPVAPDTPGLLWHWQTWPPETLTPLPTAPWQAPMQVPELTDTGYSSPNLPLLDLADLRVLQTTFEQPITTLCALWFDLKAIGAGAGPTPYDRLFNPPGTAAADYWSDVDRRRWRVYSSEPAQRQIHTRLMSALRLASQEDLLRMVEALSGVDAEVVILEGRYLTQLYRIRLLSSLLKLSIADVLRLIAVLQGEPAVLPAPLNSLAELTGRDVRSLYDRAEWMRVTGIDLSEYEFLVDDVQDNRVTLPYTDLDLVDGAATLLDAARAFFVTPTSFISEDVSEAASRALYDDLTRRHQIQELTLYLPANDDGSTDATSAERSEVTVGIVLPEFTAFTTTDLRQAVFAEPTILQELGWRVERAGGVALPPFEELRLSDQPGAVLSSQALRAVGLIDADGLVLATQAQDYSVAALRDRLPGGAEADTEKLAAIRDRLDRRRQLQSTLPDTVTTLLLTRRQQLNETLENSFIDWLDTDRDRLQTLMGLTQGITFDAGTIDAAAILQDASAIAQTRTVDPAAALVLDLAQLHKTLFLLMQFDLSDTETRALLSEPSLFDLEADSLVNPTYTDLDRLHTFERLKVQLHDAGNQLLGVLQGANPLSSLTEWSLPEIERLRDRFGIAADTPTHTLPVLNQLAQAFEIIQTLGADASYLIDLADTETLTVDFYQRHATALYDLVRAKYDDSQWPSVFKPLHDRLATRRRDSLLAYILHDLAPVLGDRKDADVLYEYLLLDVQTGSEVDTSRIVQATASLQLYVQRCLMNLEQGVRPEQIPTDEWAWMKNYRVWEANRKVFLYPENYIEPELRDTKTPLFQQLEDDLQQNEVTQDTAEAAYKRYLNKFADVTNLTIIGGYLDTDEVRLQRAAALKFSGTADFIIHPTLALIAGQISHNLTVALWVKPADVGTGGLLAAYNWNSREQKGWSLRLQGGRFHFHLSTEDVLSPTNRSHRGRMTTVSATYKVNRWYHVAVTYESNSLKLYVNGKEAANNTRRSGNIYYPDTNNPQIPFTLGALRDTDSLARFVGEMRGVEVWNTVRTAAQIQASMTQGILDPASHSHLLYYWPMNAGDGDTIADLAGSEPTDLTRPADITWTTAIANGPTPQTDVGTRNTLYLVGRNDNTQEYYLRRWVNQQHWEAWQKVDLAINADYVSPVFAFNRLFLFWAELTESVRAEDRRWVENDNRGRLLDQLGEEIELRSRQKVGDTDLSQTLADGTRISVSRATINSSDGGTLNSRTLVYSDKNGVIEQVNVSVQTIAIKYSYYNFSGDWIQPQTLTLKALDGLELNDSEKRQPNWQRVYAQRWRTADLTPPTQPEPTPITNLQVAQLGPDSVASRILEPSRDSLSLSFWLRANDLLNLTETVAQLETHTFELFNYGDDSGNRNPLRAQLTQTHSEIPGKLAIQAAVNTAEAAIAAVKTGLEAIQSFRNDTLDSLTAAQNTARASRNATLAAAAAVSDGEPAKSLATRAAVALEILAVDDAAPSAMTRAIEADSPQDSADLARRLLDVVDQAITAAATAIPIANTSSTATTALANARTARVSVKTAATNAANAVPRGSGDERTGDAATVETETHNAVQAAINCLNFLTTVLSEAQVAESQVPKYRRGPLELHLQVGATPQTLVSSLPYGQWHHVALILSYNAGQYTVTAYLYTFTETTATLDIETLTFTTDLLPPSDILRIGRTDNPAASGDTAQYQPRLSEFRVWGYARTQTDIAADRFSRLHGREFGLSLHLPLDDQAGLTRVEATGLSLEQRHAPSVASIPRERIVLIYGNGIVQTLRNTLKDIGYEYTLAPTPDVQNPYSLGLGNLKAGAIAGRDDDASIILDSYVSGALHPYDRFHPQDRDVLNDDVSQSDKSPTLQNYIEDWNDQTFNTVDQTLLQNSNQSSDNSNQSQIEIDESYILDIHNQPNWFVLDIGDEIFLVQLHPGDQYVQTLEERLRAAPTGGSTRKTFDLYFDLDFALQANGHPPLNVEFLRLNTFAVQALSERLFAGIDTLLSLETQIEVQERDFGSLIGHLDGNDPNLRVTASGYFPEMEQGLRNPIDFEGAYGIYYQEVFFHIPFLIANQLSANQKFAEAQRWYHYIFDPTAQASEAEAAWSINTKDRYWRYRPFRGLSLETLAEMLANGDALDAYRKDPFDPHAIARLRINTYQKAVVMKYIDNLVAWADNLFRQDTRESITEATQLYVLALNLLGPRPQAKPAREVDPVGTYEDVRDALNRRGLSSLPDFLVGNSQPEAAPTPKLPFDPHRSVLTHFGVPENAQFIGYWDTVDDRLYKIRHSLNIDGVFRTQALFQPPINPAALVNAAASGLAGGFSSALAAGSAVVPHYRYGNTLEKAKEMVGQVIDFGAALAEAIENKGAEELTLLQHAHELKILEMTTEIKQLAITQAEKNLEALEISLSGAEQRKQHFDALIQEFMSPLEIAEVGTKFLSGVFSGIAGGFKVASAISAALPTIEIGGSGFGGSPVATVSAGGEEVSEAFYKTSEFWELLADIGDRAADILGKFAEYDRRRREWEQSKTEVENEISQIKVQIEEAAAQINVASRELLIHQQTIDHHNEVGEFYRRRFFNLELRNWLVNRMSALYFQAYRIAFDLAKQAERAYQFEFGSNDTYLSFGYWDSRRKGLLAGESLRLDLMRLEQAAHDQDSRYREITKTISLARIDPLAFLQLRETGRCQFSLGELLFDRDFPGHYFRIIKSVAISIPAVVGPYESVHAMLTQTGHKTLLSPDINGVRYLLGELPEAPDSIRVDWRANQQIAISTGVEDTGMFELDFNDDRYLPFENTGVVSNWVLELPKQTNRFDFESITDVVIHLRYMCNADSGSFRQAVMDLDAFKNHRGAHLFSLAHAFSAQWFAFKNTERVDTLTLELPANAVPPNLTPESVTLQPLYGVAADGTLTPVNDNDFEVTPPTDLSAKPLTVTLTTRNFQKANAENLLVLLRYQGTV